MRAKVFKKGLSLSLVFSIFVSSCGSDLQTAPISPPESKVISSESVKAEIDAIVGSTQGVLSEEQVQDIDLLGSKVAWKEAELESAKELMENARRNENGDFESQRDFGVVLFTLGGAGLAVSLLVSSYEALEGVHFIRKNNSAIRRLEIQKAHFQEQIFGKVRSAILSHSNYARNMLLESLNHGKDQARAARAFQVSASQFGAKTEDLLRHVFRVLPAHDAGSAQLVARTRARIRELEELRRIALVDDFEMAVKELSRLGGEVGEKRNMILAAKNRFRTWVGGGLSVALFAGVVLTFGDFLVDDVDFRITRLDGRTFEQMRDIVEQLKPQYEEALKTFLTSRAELLAAGRIPANYPADPRAIDAWKIKQGSGKRK